MADKETDLTGLESDEMWTKDELLEEFSDAPTGDGGDPLDAELKKLVGSKSDDDDEGDGDGDPDDDEGKTKGKSDDDDDDEGAGDDDDEGAEGDEGEDPEITLPDGSKTPLSELELELPNGETLAVKDIEQAVMTRGMYDEQVAEHREHVAQLEQTRQLVEQRLENLEEWENYVSQLLESFIPDHPPEELARTNGEAYHKAVLQREAIIATINEKAAELQQGRADRQKATDADMQGRAQAVARNIVREFPELADGQVFQSAVASFNGFMTDMGYSDAELTRMDHRDFRLAVLAFEALENRKGKQQSTEQKQEKAKRLRTRIAQKKKQGRSSTAIDAGRASSAMKAALKPGGTDIDTAIKAVVAGGLHAA